MSANNIVVVIVHDRFENLKRWVECWAQCEKGEAELRIIHNYANQGDLLAYKNFCLENNISYTPRHNVGMDIGCFQDVCRQRLIGFDNDWKIMLWVRDDTVPMSKDFFTPFLRYMADPKTGVACMEISNEVRPHIRRTGFCIKKEIANGLIFPCDPVSTKEHCWQFEHRDINNLFLRQVEKNGFRAVQIAELKTSPLWDIDKRANLNRMREHELVFYPNKNPDKIIFISLIYNSYPYIISSLLAQTHKNWELVLIHDGKNYTHLKDHVDSIKDSRIVYIETEESKGNWGHYWRHWAIQEIKQGRLANKGDYIVITNADNYYAPVAIEYLLKGFIQPDAVASYCSSMVHSYVQWEIIQCRPEFGYIDCGGVMVKKDVACEVGWNNVTEHSADWLYFRDIIKRYGISSFKKVQGCLLVHN